MADAAAPIGPTTTPTVTGTVESIGEQTLVLKLPGTDYRLHLVPAEGSAFGVGQRVTGVVRAHAQRMDVVPAGGRYVEPVFGRPRRVQGRVTGGSVQRDEVYVKAGPGLVIQPMAPQRAGDFAVGQMVSFDVKRGATFTPVDEPA
ncbi:MAG: hypothetical protein AAGC44_15145 [Planctomycetota bacterium]